MYGKQLSNQRYKRCLELFAVIYEEIGEAQKAFNDYAWKNSKKYGKIISELQQVESPLQELIDTLKDTPIQHVMSRKVSRREYEEGFAEEKCFDEINECKGFPDVTP